MKRFVAGAVLCLAALTGGLLWWQSRIDGETPAVARAAAFTPPPLDSLPEGDPDAQGEAPPLPPEALPQDREAKRFARYDRDRDGVVTRLEMMASRARDFRKLDKDGNNLLSFEEWAFRTSDRFAEADGNRDRRLTREEFARTATKTKPQGKARCAC